MLSLPQEKRILDEPGKTAREKAFWDQGD